MRREMIAATGNREKMVEIRQILAGSDFDLVTMKDAGLEKRMIDELRCLNGNLKISLGLATTNREVL